MIDTPNIAALVLGLQTQAGSNHGPQALVYCRPSLLLLAAATLEAVAKERDELQQINLRQSLTE